MPSDPYAILRKSGTRQSRMLAVVGAVAFALGLLVVTLRIGDPVGQGLALVFAVLGAAMLAAGIFRGGGQLAGLEDRLRDRPQTIVRAWRQVAKKPGTRPRPEQPIQGQHQAAIEADDGTLWVIDAPAGKVGKILDLVASRNPTAEILGR